MADINQSTWSPVDNSNNATPPAGWPSGTMQPVQVEPTARAMQGAVKRWYNQINFTATSGGTANAQTLTYAVAPAAIVAGDRFAFIPGAALTNTGATTLNINGLGTIAVVTSAGGALTGGEITASIPTEVEYDGVSLRIINPTIPTTLTGVTLVAPILSGTATGTYTLGGTPTLASPVLSGTATGTYTLAAPILSGTVTGTYTLGGTPTFPASGVTAASYTNTNLTVGADGRITAASNGAAVPTAKTAKSVASTAGTTSAAVMAGLAGTITPLVSGNVEITISGNGQNNTAGLEGFIQIATGTGSAPANGAASTGTTHGSVLAMTSAAISAPQAFSKTFYVTGLTLSTAVWIDVVYGQIGGGSFSLANIDIIAREIP